MFTCPSCFRLNTAKRNVLNNNLRQVHFGIGKKSGVKIVPTKQRKCENKPNTTNSNIPKQKRQGKVFLIHARKADGGGAVGVGGGGKLILNLGARWRWVLTSRPGRFISRKKTIPSQWESGWTPELVWTISRRHKSLDPRTIRTVDRPARCMIYMYIQGVTGGTDQTSGGCSLC